MTKNISVLKTSLKTVCDLINEKMRKGELWFNENGELCHLGTGNHSAIDLFIQMSIIKHEIAEMENEQ